MSGPEINFKVLLRNFQFAEQELFIDFRTIGDNKQLFEFLAGLMINFLH